MDILLDSTHTVALTGPWASRESGVPDFRTPGEGLWTMVNPVFFTLEGFKSNPAEFYRLGIKLYQHIQKCSPNVTHFTLAEMQRRGLVRSIITQNIDGLHQRAGSERVYEVNGNMRSASCLGCAHQVSVEEVAAKISGNQLPPLCDHCGSLLKPDVVLIDEGLALDYTAAFNEARAADLLLIIGADMSAAPANLLPYSVKSMIIVNNGASVHDQGARVVIHGRASAAMRAIMEELSCRTDRSVE